MYLHLQGPIHVTFVLGGLVTPADSMTASLGMGLSIASKLEGECLGGCGVVMAQWSEHWRLKPEALGLIPGGCPDVFSSSKLSDVDGVMSSVVL